MAEEALVFRAEYEDFQAKAETRKVELEANEAHKTTVELCSELEQAKTIWRRDRPGKNRSTQRASEALKRLASLQDEQGRWREQEQAWKMEQSQLLLNETNWSLRLCNWALTTEQDSTPKSMKKSASANDSARRDEGHGSG